MSKVLNLLYKLNIVGVSNIVKQCWDEVICPIVPIIHKIRWGNMIST